MKFPVNSAAGREAPILIRHAKGAFLPARALIGGSLAQLNRLSIGAAIMDEEALNISVRKFLKKLGVTAQREIEMAVRDADAKGLLTTRCRRRRLSRSAASTSDLRSMATSSWRDGTREMMGRSRPFSRKRPAKSGR